jgi:hypothetical protein
MHQSVPHHSQLAGSKHVYAPWASKGKTSTLNKCYIGQIGYDVGITI